MNTPFAICADTETTGTSVLEDRVVAAYIGLLDQDGNILREQSWIVDPGVPIPADAAAVHGYNDARIKAEANSTPAQAIEQIFAILRSECEEGGLPLIGANFAFDASILEAERRRHAPHVPPLHYWDGGEGACVFDTYVADKMVDRYRKGSRKLIDTARHYGIPLDEAEAHAASFDAIAAGRIALKLLQRDPFNVGDWSVIHEGLALAKAEQSASLEAWFAKSGKTEPDGTPIVCDRSWPLHSALNHTLTSVGITSQTDAEEAIA